MRGAVLPQPSAFVNLELEADAYAGVPCWSAGPTKWAHITVAVAYDLHYPTIRPQMCDGGIAKKPLIIIAAAMAHYADWGTGRNCRATNDQLAARTGFHLRTIQRARECLRLLGVATEILRGRQRTYTERMASWRMGDRHRGWASVWALHDNAQINRVIHNLSPHLERSRLTTRTSPHKKLFTTHAGASARKGAATRRLSPDKDGQRLAARWRAEAHAPPWARRYGISSWAAMLAAPAAAGWTPRDLTALVGDWLGTGHRIPSNPHRPIALLGTLLAWHTSHNSLQDRPAALDEAREAAEVAAARERVSQQLAQRTTTQQARDAARAALGGDGHQAARAAAAAAARNAAARRTISAAAEAAVVDAAVRRARGLN
ncbi:replication protein Rep [Mycobacterium lentiflavum]|uniref:Helix-turn-helix domain-containing protein n=2 Tax=Mycobacterium simiae complex TaxID=2249310 RepID=A0A0E4H3G5_MYCLN|nr:MULTISPECIES: hypothetical protein [Mycobacterium simiae complex]ORJ54319.1 helix-turn-helix domain-containing protein [Mycobacterium simiae]ULP45433.1 helix-turn-helix domain-containing protein [Mycobacterium lentiflavum]CQD24582.1 replication protein Rep [Mycobacterium lentiflavum]